MIAFAPSVRLKPHTSYYSLPAKIGKPEELSPYYQSIERFKRHNLQIETFKKCYPAIIRASDLAELHGLGEVDPNAYELFANHFFMLEKQKAELSSVNIAPAKFAIVFAKLTEAGASYEELSICTKYCIPMSLAPNELLSELVEYYEDYISPLQNSDEKKASVLEDKVKDLLKEHGLERFILPDEEPNSFASLLTNHFNFHTGFIAGSYLAKLLGLI